MNRTFIKHRGTSALLGIALMFLFAAGANANAVIPGITGPNFTLRAAAAHIDTPDGDSLLIWAYGDAAAGTPEQLPGPTLIVNQGDVVTVNLGNQLTVPVSMVFPGQTGVTATPAGGPTNDGLLTLEAGPGGTVQYQFTAIRPGTFLYHSGTRPELQVEMGLYGALIVRPTGFDQDTNRTAYGHPDSAYDHEYLFLLSEMDPNIHDLVDFGFMNLVDNTEAFPVFWFINGRNGLDTTAPPDVPWQPHQPYNALARTHPGEKVLLRMIGAGRDLHPFHPHGDHHRIIARDAMLLSSAPGRGANLATDDFTTSVLPGATVDAIFDWTGYRLGWDIYGPIDTECTDGDNDGFDDATGEFCHDATCFDTVNNETGAAGSDKFDDATYEWCKDHGKPLPVTLPELQDLRFGGWFSGSPFLGSFGNLPPGEGGLNLNAGLFFMWHSHNEKELTDFDIFPGGMLTFVIIEPPGTPIP